MKRTITWLLVCSLLLGLLAGTALAEGGEACVLADIGAEVTFPADQILLTRQTPTEEKQLRELGYTRAGLTAWMEEAGVYAMSVDPKTGDELLLTWFAGDGMDYRAMTAPQLAEQTEALSGEYGALGLTVGETGVQQAGGYTFLTLAFTQEFDGNAVESLQYQTNIPGTRCNLTLHSYDGPVTLEQAEQLRLTAESLQLQEPEADPNAPQAELYRDSRSGLTFSIPAGWREDLVGGEQGPVSLKLTSTEEPELHILYTVEDVYGSLSETERAATPRSKVQNDYFSGEELEKLCKARGAETTKVTYGTTEYHHIEQEQKNADGDPIPLTLSVRIADGYLYVFTFNGERSGPWYEQYESLVASAVYPQRLGVEPEAEEVPEVPGEQPEPETPAAPEPPTDKQTNIWAVAGAVILTALVVLALWAWSRSRRSRHRRRPAERRAAPRTAEHRSASSIARYCPHCGRRVQAGSRVCRSCGAELPPRDEE